eukprot:Awhi_evm2s9391
MSICLNLIVILTFLVIMVYTTAIAFYGLFSLEWYTGNGINIDIPSGCTNLNSASIDGSYVTYCSSWQWSDLQGSKEKAMAGLEIACIILGISALFSGC